MTSVSNLTPYLTNDSNLYPLKIVRWYKIGKLAGNWAKNTKNSQKVVRINFGEIVLILRKRCVTELKIYKNAG